MVDEAAEDIDYDDLLADMQEGTRESNALRAQNGHATVTLEAHPRRTLAKPQRSG